VEEGAGGDYCFKKRGGDSPRHSQVGRSNEASILPLEFCYHTRRWCGLISAEEDFIARFLFLVPPLLLVGWSVDELCSQWSDHDGAQHIVPIGAASLMGREVRLTIVWHLKWWASSLVELQSTDYYKARLKRQRRKGKMKSLRKSVSRTLQFRCRAHRGEHRR